MAKKTIVLVFDEATMSAYGKSVEQIPALVETLKTYGNVETFDNGLPQHGEVKTVEVIPNDVKEIKSIIDRKVAEKTNALQDEVACYKGKLDELKNILKV